ncbi:MAG: hypothetical protein FJW20_03560 [Acidimicrobiia bacterium]|nr:hypothetical protein [Acidimicrobiia bacterium]
MRVKSYFAGTVEAAMALAGKELGVDAMLVYSRESAPEARYLGKYEVVFALPSSEPAAPALPAPTASMLPAPATPFPAATQPAVADALASLTRQLEAMSARIERLTWMHQSRRSLLALGAGSTAAPPGLPQDLLERLELAGIGEPLSDQVLDSAAQTIAANPALDATSLLRRTLSAMAAAIPVSPAKQDHSILTLIGPPGSGKTTALVKLAATLGARSRRPVQLISFDSFRIAAAEQLRTYAGILGIGFQAVETVGSLLQCLEEHRFKEYILIDTPGIANRDFEAAEDLERFLRLRNDVEVHLTLSASMKSADLSRVADRFERFRPNKLIFTRLDETSCYGSIWTESVKRSKPVSFLCNGQQIPEDLLEATPEAIVAMVLGLSPALSQPDWFTSPPLPGGSSAAVA